MNKNEDVISQWLALKKWELLPFQKEVLTRFWEGKSGLVSVPTGAGKTYSVYLPALEKLHKNPGKGLRILYITPLRALAKDLEYALKAPIEDLKLGYKVEKRTGDTTAAHKAKQNKTPPHILLTTPESLALMLTDPKAKTRFSQLQTIIVDEWHELMSSKRGVLFELSLSRLKVWSREVQIWGLTATIGNLQEAAQVCIGGDRTPTLVTAHMDREIILKSVLPKSMEKLPWAGHLGMQMLPFVIQHLAPSSPTLIFTNTRSQAERWYQALIAEKPEWEKLLALHHSSIAKKAREKIEEDLKAGILRFVVCTSSLDLGIDMPSVEKVVQIGSPKSISRLIQRAGRSSHKPLTPCHIVIVPTHALEVVELKGYRMALQARMVEERSPLKMCYDVLLQHIITAAIGGGFTKEALFAEITTTSCFATLTLADFEKCLQFLVSGGTALHAYEDYKKLVLIEGYYRVLDRLIIQRHKMHIGTIASDPYVPVKLLKGKTLGMMEESFITHLKPGDTFVFAGKRLKLLQYRDMTAYVRLSPHKTEHTAIWGGSRLPFSAPLGQVLRQALAEYEKKEPEDAIVKEIVKLQMRFSQIPQENELLIEVLKTREGWHLFVYPFEGKTIHEGLGLLVAHRLSKKMSATLTLSCNDYGFELLSSTPFGNEALNPTLFSPQNAQEEMVDLTNVHEAGKGCFRDIARISGLIFQGFPGKNKSHRQVHLTTGLLYEVLEKYDPDNLLIQQAKKEVFEKHFESQRLTQVLERLFKSHLSIKILQKFTPFCLPLFIERIQERVSTETIESRIKNIQESWAK